MKKQLTLLLFLFSPALLAGKADVIDVKVRCSTTCTFSVTLKHADTGWEHYANEWVVVAPDGAILGSRVLLHPHVKEQPFTRSLSGVKIPANVKQVTIRAKDSVHGFGGIEKQIKIP